MLFLSIANMLTLNTAGQSLGTSIKLLCQNRHCLKVEHAESRHARYPNCISSFCLYTRWKKPSPVFYTSAELQIADSRLISSRCAGGSLAGYPSARMHIGTQQLTIRTWNEFSQIVYAYENPRTHKYLSWWLMSRCALQKRSQIVSLILGHLNIQGKRRINQIPADPPHWLCV